MESRHIKLGMGPFTKLSRHSSDTSGLLQTYEQIYSPTVSPSVLSYSMEYWFDLDKLVIFRCTTTIYNNKS
ncbi:unnamed protein product [Adineta ricciae]|uniref:Uncharacterized protein n=1 Tax=Adineta ricciae TaxID=249248 RepID=A0A816BSN9_ADIRI|nr:unnamed protein product [Adineta ricciae]